MSELELLDEHFVRRPIEMPQRENRENDKARLIPISLIVLEKSRLDVEEWLGVENVRPMKDGYFAEANLPFDSELVSKLLSFGDGVQILAPQELRAAVKEALRAALTIYEF